MLAPQLGRLWPQRLALMLMKEGGDGVDIDTDDIIIHPVYLRARLILTFNNWSKMTSVH